MSNWKAEKEWSDGLLLEVKKILGLYLIGEANEEDDQKRCTDLIVMKMESVRVACRLRRYKYFINPEYRRQFTIRSALYSGVKTELAKIIEGWGDYYFYGFADENDLCLIGWTLADLKPFRSWHSKWICEHDGKCPGLIKNNGEKDSDFRVFNWNDMPEKMIIAQNL